MSVSYSDITQAIEQAAGKVGVSFNSIGQSSPIVKSAKAAAGSGGKVVASLTDLSFQNSGRSADHGDNLTTGNMTVVLRPSTASTEVNLDSVSALMEIGHKLVLAFDGQSGIRATVSRVAYAGGGAVTVSANLVFGIIVVSKDTNDLLLGRV